MAPASPRLVGPGVRRIRPAHRPLRVLVGRRQSQLFTGPLRDGRVGVLVDEAPVHFVPGGRIALRPVRLGQPVEGLGRHRVIRRLVEHPTKPGLRRVGTACRPKERVGQLVLRNGPLVFHLRPTDRVPRHGRHVHDTGRGGRARGRLRAGLVFGLVGTRAGVRTPPDRLCTAPVVHEGPVAPRLLELAASLLHEGRIAVKQEAGVGPLRLDGGLFGRGRGGVSRRRTSPAPELRLPTCALGSRLLLFQSPLANLLHDGPELRGGHAAEAQKGIHPGDGLGAIRQFSEAVCLGPRVRWRPRKDLGRLLRPRPLIRAGREGRRGRVEMRRGPGEVLVRIPVQRRQLIVSLPLPAPPWRLVAPQDGREHLLGPVGPSLRAVQPGTNPGNLRPHLTGVVVPFQLCQPL
ncbi:hypothetical protein SARU107417_10085 [Salinibacter ruber]